MSIFTGSHIPDNSFYLYRFLSDFDWIGLRVSRFGYHLFLEWEGQYAVTCLRNNGYQEWWRCEWVDMEGKLLPTIFF